MGAEKKLKKCIEKNSVLVRRSGAEARGNAPIELSLYRSVRESSELPRVISRGSVQKRLEFQPKGSAIFQNWRCLLGENRAFFEQNPDAD